jgi:hypothetical protein
VDLRGELTTFDQVAAYRRATPNTPWNIDHWAVICREIESLGGQGAKGVIKSAADKLGITVRALNDRLKKHPVQKTLGYPNSVFSLCQWPNTGKKGEKRKASGH